MSFLNGRTNRLLLLWSLITFLMVPTTIAQETTAGIQGTVKDPSGGVLPGATMEVTGTALIGTKKVTSAGTNKSAPAARTNGHASRYVRGSVST